MPKITIDISDDLHGRLDVIAKNSGVTKESLVVDGLEALIDHFDDMFNEIKKLMEENPKMSMEEIEEKLRDKFDLDDDDDTCCDHSKKGCCSHKP